MKKLLILLAVLVTISGCAGFLPLEYADSDRVYNRTHYTQYDYYGHYGYGYRSYYSHRNYYGHHSFGRRSHFRPHRYHH